MLDEATIAISDDVVLHTDDLQWSAVRAQGAGGQHVNKTSSAVIVRLDLRDARLPDWLKQRLLSSDDSRISNSGVLSLRAQQSRSQHANKRAALVRLVELLKAATKTRKKRKVTRPSRASVRRRLAGKQRRSLTKQQRRRPSRDVD